MKFIKSKSKLLLVLLLTMISTFNMQGKNKSYFDKLGNKIQRRINDQINYLQPDNVQGENQSYIDRLCNKIQCRINDQIDYLHSDVGIEKSIDAAIAATITVVSTVAYVYLVIHLMHEYQLEINMNILIFINQK